MKRTDNDTWNLARSVGATATMVAAARAAASRRPDPIINDPFAEPLVRGAGVDLFARLARGDLEFSDVDSGWIPDFFAVRARFFDAFVETLKSESARQVVVVGSGLDSRAYRLEWPTGTVVYEIDQPEVIDSKESTMARLGAFPTVELRSVGVDLRHDWPTALQKAGFDPERPTAWLAEGLMIGYLPVVAQERLLRQITELSAAGSRMAADHLPGESASIGSLLLIVAERWKEQGFDVDFGNLTYPHEGNDAEEYLQAHGWSTCAITLDYLLAAAGLTNHGMDTGPHGQGAINYLTAIRCSR
jgi:methyltransferase (TIGR00027 family)